MRQIPIIAFNAFMELVRQPVFLLLFCVSSLLIIILAAVPYFGFGGTDLSPVNADIKMVKDGALSVMLISGLLAAVICASSSLSREISTGTALAVLSKPVGRMHFIIGKYLGIIGGLSVGTYLNLIVLLLASRQAYDAYGNPDIVGVMTLGIFIALAFIFAGMANYFFQKPFVPWATGMLAVAMTLGFLTICTQDKKRAWWLVDSGAGISAKFSDIWVFTDGAGIDADGKPIRNYVFENAVSRICRRCGLVAYPPSNSHFDGTLGFSGNCIDVFYSSWRDANHDDLCGCFYYWPHVGLFIRRICPRWWTFASGRIYDMESAG